MERRAASHTEEEEMNQRRKLLGAARRGDTKAISKLFELYQVRVLSGEQLVKVNRSMIYMAPVAPARGGKSSGKGAKPTQPTLAKPAKPIKAKSGKQVPAATAPVKKPVQVRSAERPTVKHKATRRHK
jgi:hypothetical protein